MAARVRSVALAVLLVGMVAAPVGADPVTVTGGSLTVAWDDPSGFLVVGEGFRVSGFFVGIAQSPQQFCFSGCLPGSVINMSAVAGGGTGFSLGQSFTAIVDGTDFVTDRWIMLRGTLSFFAGDVVVPPLVPVGSGSQFLFTPFVMNGSISGFAREDVAGQTSLFDLAVAGSGTARLRLVPRADGTYGFPEALYEFEDPAPIPEPTTLLMSLTGLTGLIVARRNRRRGGLSAHG